MSASPCSRLVCPLPAAVVLFLFVSLSACGGARGGPDVSKGVLTPTSAGTAVPRQLLPSTSLPSASDPATAVLREITAAQERYYQSFQVAVAHPGDQRGVEGLLASYTASGEPARRVRAWLRYLADSGFAARSGLENRYVIEKIDAVAADPERVVATVCGFDDGVIFDARQKAPDGSEIVVDDVPLSQRTLFTWVKRDTWQIDAAQVLNTWEGRDGCPPSKRS